MKKFLSVALVLSLALSLAACKSGSKYKKADKKMISAAENCFDAAEMTTKQKRNAIKKNLRVADTTFGDGAYLHLTSDDLEDMDYEEDKFNSDEIKVSNMTMFAKVDGDVDQVYATIAEMKNEEFAQDLYDYYYELQDLDKVKKKVRQADEAEIGYNDDEDDRFAYIVQMEGYVDAGYLHIDGKIVTVVQFTGTEDGDLVEEFYDFMREADYEDMEVLLKGE
ncbi:MAG TPA: hypothetical protein DEO39_03920 [Clostridiales bacterium]|nr:hypothetical protein [Clostridiales bacterium]